jgi:hypothetical protein
MKSKLIILNIVLFILYLSPLFLGVNICPPDKARTEITIEHSRHPQNIPLGITDNTIDVTITLNAIDKQTGKKIPLANKEVLIELVIGSKFIARNQDGSFTLSDQSSPFPLNTSQNGTISFTIYTQPPLLENATDPRKISYSITASFTPKPKEPLMGSSKTENYVPGVFPIISMAACAPLFIIFALLVAAMFAAGKNPFGLFDFSRVAFKAPSIPAGRVTPRVKTTAIGAAAGVAQQVGLKPIAATAFHKVVTGVSNGLKVVGKAVSKVPGVSEATESWSRAAEKRNVGGWILRAIGNVAKTPGRILMSGVSTRLTEEQLKNMIQKEKQAAAKRNEPIPSDEEVMKNLFAKGTLVKGAFGEIRQVTAPEKFQLRPNLFLRAFAQQLGQIGTRPWSLAYAYPPRIEFSKKYTKDEQEEIKKNVEKSYGVKLTDKDVDIYGLTESGKKKILDSISSQIEKALKGQLTDEETKLLKGISVRFLIESGQIYTMLQAPSKQFDPKEVKERLEIVKEQIGDKILKKDLEKIIKKIDEGDYASAIKILKEPEVLNWISNLSSNGMLNVNMATLTTMIDYNLGVKGAEYYRSYGTELLKSYAGEYANFALAHGIELDRLIEAFEKNDPEYIKNYIERNKNDSSQLTALSMIMQPAAIGYTLTYFGTERQNEQKINDAVKNGLNDELKKFIINQDGFNLKSDKNFINAIESLKKDENIKKMGIELGKQYEDSILNMVNNKDKINTYLDQNIRKLKDEIDHIKSTDVEWNKPENPNYKKVNELEKQESELRKIHSNINDGIEKIANTYEMLNQYNQIYNTLKNAEVIPNAASIHNSLAIQQSLAAKSYENTLNLISETCKNINEKVRGIYTGGDEKLKKMIEEIKDKTLQSNLNVNSIYEIKNSLDETSKNITDKKEKIWENMRNTSPNNEKYPTIKEEYNKIAESEKSINELQKQIKDVIEQHENENSYSPFKDLNNKPIYILGPTKGEEEIAEIKRGDNKFSLKADAIEKVVTDNRDESVRYYLETIKAAEKKEIKEKEIQELQNKANEERNEFTDKFYGIYKGKERPTEVTIQPGPEPTNINIEKIQK